MSTQSDTKHTYIYIYIYISSAFGQHRHRAWRETQEEEDPEWSRNLGTYLARIDQKSNRNLTKSDAKSMKIAPGTTLRATRGRPGAPKGGGGAPTRQKCEKGANFPPAGGPFWRPFSHLCDLRVHFLCYIFQVVFLRGLRTHFSCLFNGFRTIFLSCFECSRCDFPDFG
jgi:hypothetical protein